VKRLGILLAAWLSACAAPTPAPPPLADQADALMRPLVAQDRFQGAVVILRGGRVAYAAGFGFADIERRVPFSADTPMDSASIAKPFTAAALLMLAHEGRVDLDAPVQSLLPAYPHGATRLRHLLAHSAGLPDYAWFDPPRSPPDTVRSNASHLALLAREAPPPAFVPGTGYQYDNLAFDMAALAIERITGQSYAQQMAQRFFRPLGLEAFVRPARFADWPGPRTRAYRRTPEGWRDHDAHDFEGFHGAANIMLSARDLARWMDGWRRVVGAEVARTATAPARLDDGRATGMARGGWYASADGQRRYYTGSHNGFYSFGYADDARGIAVAWLSNDTTPSWLRNPLARALIAVAEGREPEPLNLAPGAAQTVADPSGRYRVEGLGEVALRIDGRRLFVRIDGVEQEAFTVARGVRYLPGRDATLRFSTTPQGRVAMAWDSVFVTPPPTLRESG
jgi:CubicO group peptidase (beta-lactamase class C family)